MEPDEAQGWVLWNVPAAHIVSDTAFVWTRGMGRDRPSRGGEGAHRNKGNGNCSQRSQRPCQVPSQLWKDRWTPTKHIPQGFMFIFLVSALLEVKVKFFHVPRQSCLSQPSVFVFFFACFLFVCLIVFSLSCCCFSQVLSLHLQQRK